MNAEEKSRHMKREQFKNKIWLWVMLSNEDHGPALRAQRSHNLVVDHDSHHAENPNELFWCAEKPSWLPDSCWPQGYKEEPGSGDGSGDIDPAGATQQMEFNELNAKKEQEPTIAV